MNVAVVGLGLIGGSFEKASLRAGHATVSLHHGDETGFEQSDIVLVCLPPEAIAPWIADHAARFKPGAIVVDICGVKSGILAEMERVPRVGWTFVGGHPMAGREVSGYENSLATLFDGASMILTPFAGTSDEVLATLRAFFASVGFAETVVTTPQEHDEMIAFTSQLCHIIATTYARDPRVAKSRGFSAGSYANMTRIATQDAAIWRSLYSSNRKALVAVIDGFAARLADMRAAIAADDAPAVERIIVEGAKAKMVY